ncbi:MBL fold metallo-hydrolase [Azospirillum halopraeferens]|uniref:MBL fold metallo-hydrolase n=1 Tax=Azospirillum halopraeferens TaxID=34010 RepID=UPI0004914F94|nr:MBL fold metallo-hydrolase [Azospirillum halopraeferens]
MARLTVLSGVGAKGPACFLVEAAGRRLLLDLGEGPDAGMRPDLSGLDRVDAILLSHGHPDHTGALDLRRRLGDPPVWATAPVLEALPVPEADRRVLPLRGITEVSGVVVETGRSGHAPGGVWLRPAVGGGLLYMGDSCPESDVYAYDPPPPAATLVLDASYGVWDDTRAACRAALDPWFDRPALVMPVPAGGRGPEIALHLLATGRPPPALDAANRAALDRLTGDGADGVRPGALSGLRRLAAVPGTATAERPVHGIVLAATADASGGLAGTLAAACADAAEPAILFTGYLGRGTPAERLVAAGRAAVLRWPVHPRLSANADLVRATAAVRVVPAFGDARHLAVWSKTFAPAAVTLDRTVDL